MIDTANNNIIATVDIEDAHAGFAITPCGTKEYAANPGSNVVSVIDTSTNAIISTIPVGIKPKGVAITSDGSKKYVANSASCSISIIDNPLIR